MRQRYARDASEGIQHGKMRGDGGDEIRTRLWEKTSCEVVYPPPQATHQARPSSGQPTPFADTPFSQVHFLRMHFLAAWRMPVTFGSSGRPMSPGRDRPPLLEPGMLEEFPSGLSSPSRWPFLAGGILWVRFVGCRSSSSASMSVPFAGFCEINMNPGAHSEHHWAPALGQLSTSAAYPFLQTHFGKH